MRSAVRKMGNSSGVIIPKPLLLELGLTAGDNVELDLENGRLVIAPISSPARIGWAEDAKRIAHADGDQLALGDFANDGDGELIW